MQYKIPVPTDNIYKFYALFSLVTLVFCAGATIYVGRSTNDVVLESIVEIETIKQEKAPTSAQLVRRSALERKVEIATSNRKIFLYALGVLIGLSGLGIFYGFRKWHMEVQPVLDESAEVQLEISKLQLEKLKAEMGERVA